ncbi:type VII secretion-associated serine protease mycosin [Nocardia sp. NPDC127579]|uniref:type VII secretion-associated serine protease mycosin n=1 Tax=Nocardia sp. NPDC127579 TaxID=3345402 RepID=UPI00362E106F
MPLEKTERPASNGTCNSTVKGGDGPTIPAAQQSLDLERAWQFSKGAGQVVAVIDTGVAPHPRLPGLRAEGDYVANSGDGSEDCDAHGTFVAGLIAATRVDGQGFAGVAPEAQIMSIRQTSKLYQKEGASQNKRPEDYPEGYGSTTTMAKAIVRAVDKGATVINISLVACGISNTGDLDVGAALKYAVDQNVVVVASAGNEEDRCKTPNQVIDPLDPTADPWSNVSTQITPVRWDEYVLSVGSIDANGAPSSFTVPGPWLSVAAPGSDMTSLNPIQDNGQWTTAVGKVERDKQLSISGTSFASPIVAGVVALVRARFPEMSAREVMKRIQATAHAPAEGWNKYIGYGAVDPVAALTDVVSGELPPKRPTPAKSQQLAVPKAPPPPDNTARNVSLIGTGIIGSALILGYLASFPIRRRFGVRNDEA